MRDYFVFALKLSSTFFHLIACKITDTSRNVTKRINEVVSTNIYMYPRYHDDTMLPWRHTHRDSEWTRIQTTAAKKTLLLGQIKMATHNLYTLVYKHLKKKVNPQEADETLLQLDKVSMYTHTHTFAYVTIYMYTYMYCTSLLLPMCLNYLWNLEVSKYVNLCLFVEVFCILMCKFDYLLFSSVCIPICLVLFF